MTVAPRGDGHATVYVVPAFVADLKAGLVR